MPQANESYRTHREYQRSRSRSPRPRSVQQFERRRSYRPRTVRHHDRSRLFSSSGFGAEAGDRFGERKEGGSWHRGPRHRRSSRDRASRHESTAGERPAPYGGVETWANEVPTHLSSIPVQSTEEEHDATHVSKEATKPTLMTGDLRKHFKSGDVIGERYGGFVFGSFGVPEFNTTSAGPTSANHSVLCIVRDVYENHLTCWVRQLKGLDGVKAENHGAHLGLGRAGDNDWGCESPHEQLKMTPIAGAGHFERSTHFSARYLEDVWPTVRCFAYGRLEDRSLMRLWYLASVLSQTHRAADFQAIPPGTGLNVASLIRHQGAHEPISDELAELWTQLMRGPKTIGALSVAPSAQRSRLAITTSTPEKESTFKTHRGTLRCMTTTGRTELEVAHSVHRTASKAIAMRMVPATRT
jgi:hypothetical protein